MDDQNLLRYSRQIMLPQVDVEGQERLARSHALIIGLGGLGCPAAMYLAAAGVGTLTLVDDDRVELSNLQRQIAHTTARIGEPKVQSAAAACAALNPEPTLHTIDARLDEHRLADAVADADVALDCTDNFATRIDLNRACIRAGTPLVSGAAIRVEGQLGVFRLHQGDAACYQCVYPELADQAETCAENGVLAPVPGVIGTLQAVETIKLLLQAQPDRPSELLVWDAWEMQFRKLRLRRDLDCPACGKG